MKIGIDRIGFYAPAYYIDMTDLANARNIDPAKYTVGLGQDKQAIAPLSQDTLTLAANAANSILNAEDKEAIDLVIVATESGIDQSKSIATGLHTLLGINPFARCIEMKQACYSATAAIQLAKGHIALNPTKKALVVASDISRYGIGTGGEATQGAGAVALLISADPKIMTLEQDSTYYSDDVWDFWRPNYSDVAFVDGKFSNEQYQEIFKRVFEKNAHDYNHVLDDFSALCFHIPYTKMGLKSLRLVANEEQNAKLFENFQASTLYNRQIGNIYTGSLYLSLIGLLEHGSISEGDRIGLYSYGSGAVGEFFTGTIQENFRSHLNNGHQNLLDQRTKLTITEYEEMFNQSISQDGNQVIPKSEADLSTFYLSEIRNHQRLYKRR